LHSIKAWREGRYGVRDMEQLAERLRNMTGGLLEVVSQQVSREDSHSEAISGTRPISLVNSGSAIAGSMEPHGSANFAVQFMHLSVCQYFLTGDGFKLLDEAGLPDCFGSGHLYIAATCLRYTQLDEIEPLIIANSPSSEALPEVTSSSSMRLKHKRLTRHRSNSGKSLSVTSFGSSAANSIRRSSLPTSRTPSISARSAAVVGSPGAEISVRSTAVVEELGVDHTQLTRELLEAHTQELRPITLSHGLPGDLSEDDGPSKFEHPKSAIPGSSIYSFESFSVHTKDALLFDDPVLRLYAVEMLAHHVVAANQAGADPSNLLNMLQVDRTSEIADGCWHKWCRLNDERDLRPDTTPAYFAAERNLGTWTEWYSNHPSYRNTLDERGGNMRYLLLAAIAFGHESIVSCLVDHIDADIPVTDPWTLLHSLAANNAKSDANLERYRFNHHLLEKRLSLCASVFSKGASLVGFLFRFRDYIEENGITMPLFSRHDGSHPSYETTC
jgi:hypothetical protein